MALTVVRSCVVCGSPMETKRATKQTCGERCSKRNYRAQQRQQVTQPIKTEEVNTMSQLFQPDAAHLKRLQEIEVNFYNSRTQCNIQGREQTGLMEEFEVQGLQQGLDKYLELIKQGYTATGEIAHLPKVVVTPTVDFIILSLRKPAEQVEKDIAEILAQVESEYLARLEAEKSAAVAKEVESLLANERRKRQQAEQDAKAAAEQEEYNRVHAEVLQALGLGDKQ